MDHPQVTHTHIQSGLKTFAVFPYLPFSMQYKNCKLPRDPALFSGNSLQSSFASSKAKHVLNFHPQSDSPVGHRHSYTYISAIFLFLFFNFRTTFSVISLPFHLALANHKYNIERWFPWLPHTDCREQTHSLCLILSHGLAFTTFFFSFSLSLPLAHRLSLGRSVL